MTRIKIHDLPENHKLSQKDIRKITGGYSPIMAKVGGGKPSLKTNPWVFGAIVWGAVAVPLPAGEDDEA